MEKTAVVVEEVTRLADAELIAGLQRWVRADRSVTARLLAHLGEVDARGLYRERAWSSMFAYVVEELHMSESEACVRIAAARLGRRFPRVVELLAEGAVHLTAIKLLGPHLTADNYDQVLERARGKTAREIERLVAELAPRPDVPSRMRKLPAPVCAHSVGRSGTAPEREINAAPSSARAAGLPVAQQREMNAASVPPFAAIPQPDAGSSLAAPYPQVGSSPATSHPQVGSSPAAMPARVVQSAATAAASQPAHNDGEHFQLAPLPRNVSSTRPLRPGRYKVEFTAGEAMHGKLEQLKALLRHQVPDGDLAIILERAADLLLEKTLKSRFAQTTRPRVNMRA